MRTDWREQILERWCSYFPCICQGQVSPTTRCLPPTQLLSLSPLLSPLSLEFLSLFLWGPLKQALPVITNTQFTRGLWSKWNVSSHMMVCALYSYSVEKAEQRKQGGGGGGDGQIAASSFCGFLDLHYALILPIRTCLHFCMFLWVLCCVYRRVCAHMFSESLSETPGDGW